MASQQGPPSRPWFRLATMARPPAPAPPPPQPDQPPPPPPMIRPTLIRPAFAQTSQPPPPPQPPTTVVPPPATPPQPLVPTKPAPPSPTTLPKEPRPTPPSPNPRTPPPPPLTATTAPTTNRAATPTSSPPKLPQLKSYDTPEYDQKSVLVQETKENPKGSSNGRHTARDTHNPINGATKKPEASKKHLDSEEIGMRIITIAGENKGAIMDLKTPKFGNNPHGLHAKTDNRNAVSDGEKSGTNSDGKSEAKKNKNQKSKSPLMNGAVVNSNVQGVNNSILYNCSTTHNDPGIHLSLSRKPGGARGFLRKDHKDQMN